MRSRNIKPDFFIDEDIAELPMWVRLLFIGLWCAADKEGRIEDRPKRLKAQIFPNDEVDVAAGITMLCRAGLVTRYEVECVKCILVNGFKKHQSPHHTERASTLPCYNGELTVKAPLDNESSTVEIPLIPDSGLRIEDSLIPDPGLVSTKRGPRASKPALYRWDEFAAIYPAEKLVPDAKAKAWWRRHMTSDLLVDDLLSATRAWVDSRQYRDGFGFGCARFLTEEVWKKVPTDGARPATKDELIRANNRRTTEEIAARHGVSIENIWGNP